MRPSSSPAIAPSTPTVASAFSSGNAPVKTRLPNMSGWKRAPSSLVKKATASGRGVTTPASSSVWTISSPARTPSAPSKRPPVRTVSMWLPTHRQAVLATATEAHDIADRVDRDGEAQFAHPADDEVAALPVGLGQREAVDPAVGQGAGFSQALQARPEPRAVHSEILSHRSASRGRCVVSASAQRKGGAGHGCDNETPVSSWRPGITDMHVRAAIEATEFADRAAVDGTAQ